MINPKGFLFFLCLIFFFLKKFINKPIAGRHVSVKPANSTKTQAKSPFAEEEEEELVFNKIVGPTF